MRALNYYFARWTQKNFRTSKFSVSVPKFLRVIFQYIYPQSTIKLQIKLTIPNSFRWYWMLHYCVFMKYTYFVREQTIVVRPCAHYGVDVSSCSRGTIWHHLKINNYQFCIRVCCIQISAIFGIIWNFVMVKFY